MKKKAERDDDPYPDISDTRAIADVVAGNREMFEVLVRRYNQRLFRLGLSYLGDPAAVQDAMQETYLKAFIHLRKFRRDASAATWLTRIMINECLMALRRRRRKPEEPLADDSGSAALPAVHPPQPSTLSEMKTLLEQAITRLPPALRRVFILRDVQQLGTAETAACLGLSAANVRVRLHRAHEQLRKHLLQDAALAELFPFAAPACDPFTRRVMNLVLALPASPGRR